MNCWEACGGPFAGNYTYNISSVECGANHATHIKNGAHPLHVLSASNRDLWGFSALGTRKRPKRSSFVVERARPGVRRTRTPLKPPPQQRLHAYHHNSEAPNDFSKPITRILWRPPLDREPVRAPPRTGPDPRQTRPGRPGKPPRLASFTKSSPLSPTSRSIPGALQTVASPERSIGSFRSQIRLPKRGVLMRLVVH